MSAPLGYTPGRFAYLMEEPFTAELWAFLNEAASIRAMTRATANGQPAIAPLLPDIEQRFAGHLASPRLPAEEVAVLTNNMIKQIMESRGYEHAACGICRNSRFFKSSGLYRRTDD